MNKYDIKAVMVFIFDDNKNLLLLKRTDNEKWEPVKGGFNDGEQWLDAATREMMEETGLKPSNDIILISAVDDNVDTEIAKNTKIRGHVTYCFVSGDKPDPSFEFDLECEHSEFRWVEYGNIINEDLWPPIANGFVTEIINLLK